MHIENSGVSPREHLNKTGQKGGAQTERCVAATWATTISIHLELNSSRPEREQNTKQTEKQQQTTKRA